MISTRESLWFISFGQIAKGQLDANYQIYLKKRVRSIEKNTQLLTKSLPSY